MSGSALQVKISADVTSLQAKAAVAKSEFADLNSSVKSLAAQFVTATDEMKSTLAPQLDATAQKAAMVKSEIAALNAEMKKTVNPEAVGFFGQLSAGMTQTAEDVDGLTEKFSAFNKLAGAVTEFVMAGLAVEQVGATIERVTSTGADLNHLAQETGLTTEQLSGLKVMATETGTSFDEFTKLIQKLPSTMQQAAINPAGKAGEAFAAMGVKVTDANGQLRPMGEVLDEVSAKLATYADGTNKTALETDIFGGKIGATLIPMLNQLGTVGLQGAIEKSDELNQTWTGESAEAAEQYEQDMGRAKLAVEGITNSIVRDLIPALDAVANMMAPTLDAQISSLEGRIGEMGMRASAGMKEQLAQLEAQKKQLDDSMAQQKATAGGAAPGTVSAPTVTAGAGPQWLKDQTAALDAQNAQIEQNASSTKEANAEKLQNTIQFWQGVLASGKLSSTQELQAQDALSKAELANRKNELAGTTSAMRSATGEQTQIASAAAAAQKQIAASQYDEQVATWEMEVAQGKMTKAQEIQDEIAAKNKIYQTALSEKQKEEALDTKGSLAQAKALDDMAVMTASHDAEIARMHTELINQQITDTKKLLDEQNKAAAATQAAWQKAFQPISQAFDSSINGVMQGTETLQQAELKAAQSIALAFIDAEAKKLIAYTVNEAMIRTQGVATQLGLTAAVQAGVTAQTAAKAAGTAQGRAIDVAVGSADIQNNASRAFSGAYAAIVGIPYVGPVLAPVAAATAYAGVMAMDVLSAERGMAIPAGVNPLTQLHEKEMVLPAHIAQPLQNMIAGGFTDNSATAGDMNFHQTNHFGGGGVDEATLARAGKGFMNQLLDLSRNGTLRLPGRG